MQPTENMESPNSLFGSTTTPKRRSKPLKHGASADNLKRTLSSGQAKLAQAELAKFTRELNSSAKNLVQKNLSRQKKKHSMSVHEKHDECISHWPVVKGINQKGTWPQETALPSLTGAVPRSQLRQGHSLSIYVNKQGQGSDTLLHTQIFQSVLKHSLELGNHTNTSKQQSLEQADFVMVKDIFKDKISKSQSINKE